MLFLVFEELFFGAEKGKRAAEKKPSARRLRVNLIGTPASAPRRNSLKITLLYLPIGIVSAVAPTPRIWVNPPRTSAMRTTDWPRNKIGVRAQRSS